MDGGKKWNPDIFCSKSGSLFSNLKLFPNLSAVRKETGLFIKAHPFGTGNSDADTIFVCLV